MGLLGRIVGGALSGVGAGMAQAAEARRQQSMEMLRQQFQTERDDQAYSRTVERDNAKFGQQKELKNIDYTQDVGKIAMTGKVQQQRDATQHVYTLEEIGAKSVAEKEQIRLREQLGTARDAASIKLRDSLETGDVRSVVRGKDGQYYGVTDRGLIATGVQADPTSADKSSNGGGSLTENEQANALAEARADWRRNGKQGDEPRASDFIGMTHAEFAARRGGDGTPSESAPGLLANPNRKGVTVKARLPAPAASAAAAPAADPVPSYDPSRAAGLMGSLGPPDMTRGVAAAQRQEAGNTYTLADLKQFAKSKGMSIDEARRWASKQGMKMGTQ
jgi:hypothetical protein